MTVELNPEDAAPSASALAGDRRDPLQHRDPVDEPAVLAELGRTAPRRRVDELRRAVAGSGVTLALDLIVGARAERDADGRALDTSCSTPPIPRT